MTLLPPHMITLLEMEGTCLHKDTQEAKEQMEQEGGWDGQFSVSCLLHEKAYYYSSGGLGDMEAPLIGTWMSVGFFKNSQRHCGTVSFSGLATTATMWAHYEVPQRQESGLGKKGRDNIVLSAICGF